MAGNVILLALARISAFVLAIFATGVLISHLSTVNYDGDAVAMFESMPIIVESGHDDSRILSIIPWREYGVNRESEMPNKSRLYLHSGKIAPLNIEGNPCDATLRKEGNTWIVDVKERAETALVYWQYHVVDNEVLPLKRRVLSYVGFAMGIFPGFFFVWIVGLLGKQILKRPDSLFR